MEITEIKTRLTIAEVLEHYGLIADKNARLCCPFHEDKTPSMQVYEKTDTVYCFSSNCKTHGKAIDVIDFMMHKENLTKHAALKKATAWLAPQPICQETKEDFKTAELSSKRGKGYEYLASRGLDYQELRDRRDVRIGYNGERSPQMRNCVVFGLKDVTGQVVSRYGRSVYEIKGAKHYYSKDRRGLFPSYPKADTKHLVLTESVIDAATLLQYTGYEVLAQYGTNGLGAEHIAAMQKLKELEEITLFYDGDDAGRKALVMVSEQLKEALKVKVSYVETPEGEDISSLIQSHEAMILDHLIESRTQALQAAPFLFSNEKEKPIQETPTPSQEAGQLKTLSHELLIYQVGSLKISILGGVKLAGLDKLRVTLKIEKEGQELPVRHNLDLYHALQLEALQQKMSESFGLENRESQQLTEELISSLEKYRTERLAALQPKKTENYRLTEQEKVAAVRYLKDGALMQNTAHSIAESGLVGEQSNAMIAYLIYTSRKREHPLHLMCLGASGIGKTYLQEKIGELMPTEEKLEITTLSENAFYYFGQEELKHKLILIEDLDGAMDVLYPLRELQSKRKITKTVTLKDNKGNLKTVTLTVEGPVSVSGCTTREKLYEDNANRSILLEIDSSKEQDSRVMEYQRQQSAGQINKQQEQKTKAELQNVQRVLKPIVVRNPYAVHINLPEVVFKPRRTIGLLLSFIETITFYHQYQLEHKTEPATGQTYIESEPAHVAMALKLLGEVLFRKSDEITGASRKFLETLKQLLKQANIEQFTAKEIRKTLRMNPSNLKRYMIELERYGYIKSKGNRYKGYEYRITDMSEYQNLIGGIQADLEAIMHKIKTLSGSVVQA